MQFLQTFKAFRFAYKLGKRTGVAMRGIWDEDWRYSVTKLLRADASPDAIEDIINGPPRLTIVIVWPPVP